MQVMWKATSGDIGPSQPGAEACAHALWSLKLSQVGPMLGLKGPLWFPVLPELLESKGQPSESLKSRLNHLPSVPNWANDLASLSSVS